MSLTAIGFWLVYLAGVGAALLMPLAGILLYVLVYHINPDQQWWGATVRAIGLRSSMTVMIATAIGLVLRYSPYSGRGRQFPLPIVLGLMLVVLAVVSMTWGYGTCPRGVVLAEKIIKVMVFVLILIRCVREPHHYHLVIIAWLAGVFYIGYQAFGNVGIYQDGRLARGLGGPDFAESSGLAVHLIATLPLVGAMFFMARRWWTRGLLLITGALVINTIVMTRTRNAVVGMVAMGVVAVLSLPRGYRRKGWLAIAIGSILALQLVDPGWWQRMETIKNYQHDESALGRLSFWRAALDISGDYPFGIGLGNFHTVVRDYVPGLQIVRSAHNTFFECLADLGYPGLFLLLTTLTLTFGRLGGIWRDANLMDADFLIDVGNWKMRFHLAWHAMALRAGLAGYLACSMFTTRLWSEDMWIMIGLACCLKNIADGIYERRGAGVDRGIVPINIPAASADLGTLSPSYSENLR